MILTLALLSTIALYHCLLPKRDFYLVEIRCWEDSMMRTHARNYCGYSRKYNKKFGFVPRKGKEGCVILDAGDRRVVKIQQHVFTSLYAAKVYWEGLLPRVDGLLNVEMYLWRTVARTRDAAYCLPPKLYVDCATVELMRHQPYSKIAAAPISIDDDF